MRFDVTVSSSAAHNMYLVVIRSTGDAVFSVLLDGAVTMPNAVMFSAMAR